MSNISTINHIIANDQEILESFINESRECLFGAEKDLKCLLENLGEPVQECIERAFRSVHSLKSAAGFLGLDNVSNLALRMEEMLGHLRGGDVAPEDSCLELSLTGVSILNDMFTNPMDSSDVDTGPYQAKLAKHIAAHND